MRKLVRRTRQAWRRGREPQTSRPHCATVNCTGAPACNAKDTCPAAILFPHVPLDMLCVALRRTAQWYRDLNVCNMC